MLGSGMNLITTVIGFGMSTTFIVFICTRLLCGRLRSAESRAAAAARAPTAFDLELQSEPDQPEHPINGLEPVVVASLPTMKYHKEDFCSGEDAQCSICLGDYQEKEVLRIMPYCHHVFHLTCIDAWLQKQSTCPICRLPLHDLLEAKYVPSPLSSGALQSLDSSEVTSDSPSQQLPPDRRTASISENNSEVPETGHTTIHNLVVEQPESRR